MSRDQVLKESVELVSACNMIVYNLQLTLCTPECSQSDVLDAVEMLTKTQYEEVLEERANDLVCAYFMCMNKLPANKEQQRILEVNKAHWRKVDDNDEALTSRVNGSNGGIKHDRSEINNTNHFRETDDIYYCKSDCKKKSCFIWEKLDTTPLHLRPYSYEKYVLGRSKESVTAVKPGHTKKNKDYKKPSARRRRRAEAELEKQKTTTVDKENNNNNNNNDSSKGDENLNTEVSQISSQNSEIISGSSARNVDHIDAIDTDAEDVTGLTNYFSSFTIENAENEYIEYTAPSGEALRQTLLRWILCWVTAKTKTMLISSDGTSAGVVEENGNYSARHHVTFVDPDSQTKIQIMRQALLTQLNPIMLAYGLREVHLISRDLNDIIKSFNYREKHPSLSQTEWQIFLLVIVGCMKKSARYKYLFEKHDTEAVAAGEDTLRSTQVKAMEKILKEAEISEGDLHFLILTASL